MKYTLLRLFILGYSFILASCGSSGGGSASPSSPSSQLLGIAVNSGGTELYVTDLGLNQVDSVNLNSGALTPVTGSSITFSAPFAATFDASGDLFVADAYNDVIRELTTLNTTPSETTYAGVVGTGTYVNGCTAVTASNPTCTNAVATFYGPSGITIDNSGNLYVVDQGNGAIREITPANAGGVVSTVMNGLPTTNGSNQLFGITTDGTYYYVSDAYNNVIYKLTNTAGVWSYAPLAGTFGTASYANGTGTSAQFNTPMGLATDGTYLYVADNGNNAIRQITLTAGASYGVVTTLAGGNPGTGGAAATAGFTPSTSGAGPGTFYGPSGLALNGTNLYVVDQVGTHIRIINTSTSAISTLH